MAGGTPRVPTSWSLGTGGIFAAAHLKAVAAVDQEGDVPLVGKADAQPAGGSGQQLLDDLIDAELAQRISAVRAMKIGDLGEEDAQVVEDVGGGGHDGAGILVRPLLAEGDGRRQVLDAVDVGFLHLVQELADVGGDRLDVADVPFRVQGVECQGRLAGAADADQRRDPSQGHGQIDVLQVVGADALEDDVVFHGLLDPRRLYHERTC